MRLAVLLLLGLTFSLFAGNLATELFDQANKFYEKTEYDSAIASYEKILSMGSHDAKVYYNLGNAYFRKKELGQAILNFKKAQYLDPSDKDIAANLQFAQTATVDKIVPRETGFFTKVILSLHNAMDVSTQSVLFLILLFVLSGLLILHFMVSEETKGLTRGLMVSFFVVFVLLSLSFGVKIYQENTSQQAVVLVEKVNAMNEPDGSQVLFSVHEGTEFKLFRKVGNWYFATLENGMAGWVNENELGLVEVNE